MFDWTRDLFEWAQYELNDTTGDLTKQIKMKVPDFVGKVNAVLYSDSLSSIKEYFDWYDMTDNRNLSTW